MNDRFNGQIGGRLYEEHFGWKFNNFKEDNRMICSNWRDDLYCIDQYFNFRPYFVFQKKIVIVGNSNIYGCGEAIDSGEEIIRINNMRNWTANPHDDGLRTTVWAGLPIFAIGPINADEELWAKSKFINISKNVHLIWCVSPFQCTIDTWKNLCKFNLRDKIKTLPGYFQYLDEIYPATSHEMRKLLWETSFHRGYGGMPSFEFLLTGVKICLACFLDGAKQIDLFGFDFFANEPVWEHHDLNLNLKILLLIETEMNSSGRVFNWFEKSKVINKIMTN